MADPDTLKSINEPGRTHEGAVGVVPQADIQIIVHYLAGICPMRVSAKAVETKTGRILGHVTNIREIGDMDVSNIDVAELMVQSAMRSLLLKITEVWQSE